jgi:exopolyphosphatase/guanosine-5'-triphosphate,3'-diphosphate pyrophosphatase
VGETDTAVGHLRWGSRTVDEVTPRWEWRTFGNLSDRANRRFAGMRPERVQESDEIYLISPVLDRSMKVRDGKLDIKTLEDVNEGGLEQWRPVIKASLPLSREDIRRVSAVLGTMVPEWHRGGLSLEDLLEELSRESLHLVPVAVHKKRLHFTLGGCRAEVTDVHTQSNQTRTLALESEDPDSVLASVRELGLSHLPNTSYPRWLWTVAGSGA